MSPEFITDRARRAWPVVVALFCSFYLLSNILAVKSITIPSGQTAVNLGVLQVWPLVLDGAFVLFPITYIIDDIMTEIYGFKRARKVILLGFGIEVIAVLALSTVSFIPATPDAPVTDEIYSTVFNYVPRVVCASLAAYLVGELLNAWTLALIKKHTGEKKLWVRFLGSTVIGEAADTITFCTVAFFGTISFAEFLNYTIVGYLVKCLLEVVLLPITYRVVKWIKGGPAMNPPTLQPLV
jgi:uncharacterized integral membrane protein (TIGR00697 family)